MKCPTKLSHLVLLLLPVLLLWCVLRTTNGEIQIVGINRPIDDMIEELRFPFSKTPKYFQELVIAQEKRSEPGRYIIAESDAGLSNRLRALFAYFAIARTIYNKAHLVFVWDVNEACPGHFLSVFQPLPNVTFISSKDKEHFVPHAVAVFNNSRETFDHILFNNDMNFYVKKKFFFELQLLFYRLLQPTIEIETIISRYVVEHEVCNMTAVHVRRTDLWDTLSHRIRTAQDAYFYWVDIHTTENSSIYLLTDNPQTQKDFFVNYGSSRVHVFANITSLDGQSEKDSSSAIKSYSLDIPAAGGRGIGDLQNLFLGNNPSNESISSTKPSEKRFTGLQHAIIDIFIAAHCWQFRRTNYSSVSDLVLLLRYIHRWHWCNCPYAGC
jgi:hypothetical protein